MPRIDPAFGEERNTLFREYHPHEINPNYSKAERDKWMQEWWRKALELHHKYGIRSEDIDSIDFRKAVMRTGWSEFVDFCRSAKYPVHILSAGISQIIEHVLEENGILKDGVEVSSNRLMFDASGAYTGSNP